MFIVTAIALFFFWIILSGQLDAFHLTLGVIASLVTAFFSHDMMFQETSLSLGTRIRHSYRFCLYLIWLSGQILVANIYVLRLVFHPRLKEVLDPQFVTFKTSLTDDFAKFVFANSITLTPGTVTVRITGDEFIVHAISAKIAQSLPGDMERRIADVFER